MGAARERIGLVSATACSSRADRESASIAISIAMNFVDASGSIDLRCCDKNELLSVGASADGHEEASKVA